jgi:chromosome partitioning protein
VKPRTAPILPVMSRPRVITVTNQKGGVGKTTTAVSLGAALAERGLRVLLVDCDPQGNATSGLGVRPAELSESIYDVIVLGQPLLEVAIEVREVPGLTLVPSNVSLAGSELELAELPLRESRLRLALDGLEDYDYVLLDTPPSLGLLTVNCLVAADSLLIPLQCEYYALEGLSSLTQTQALVRRSLNPALALAGIVLTLFDPRTILSAQVVSEVRRQFGDQAFTTVIPRSVRLSEAPSHGIPITLYEPGGRAATAYRALAEELVLRTAPVPA